MEGHGSERFASGHRRTGPDVGALCRHSVGSPRRRSGTDERTPTTDERTPTTDERTPTTDERTPTTDEHTPTPAGRAGGTVTPRRSSLTTPGSDPGMMAKAAGYDADGVTLDLEDGVAEGEKERARDRVIEALRGLDWGEKVVTVRPNPLDHPAGLRDVVEVVERAGASLDALVIPKVERPADVYAVGTLLDGLAAGGAAADVGISVIVEEVGALARIDAVLGAHERVEAVSLGFGDYAASQDLRVDTIGGTADYPGDVWHDARFRTVAAARAAGVAAYEGPYADYSDPEGLREACRRSRAVGFDGKGAIHPAQLPVINEAFGE
jgi:citrate lyase subunit beta/citryl-CoA lyase